VLSIFYGWLQGEESVPVGFHPAHRPPRNPEKERGQEADVRLTRDQEARLLRSIYALINGTMKRTDKRNGKEAKRLDAIGGTALLTLLDTGRRRDEVLGMEWRRVDLEAGTVNLGATKGKKAGDTCYLTPRVCDAIRRGSDGIESRPVRRATISIISR